jgi:hypothetical protein
MKSIFTFILAIAAVGVVATSCSSGAATPGAAAKTYTQYMADGQYEKLVDNIYFEDASQAEQSKAMLVGMMKDKGAKSLEEKGGLKSFEVVSEEIAEDGKTAKVTMKHVYGNGETEEDSMDLILVDGKWLMSMDK